MASTLHSRLRKCLEKYQPVYLFAILVIASLMVGTGQLILKTQQAPICGATTHLVARGTQQTIIVWILESQQAGWTVLVPVSRDVLHGLPCTLQRELLLF